MLELIDGETVRKAGAKVLDLAEVEHWSNALLYVVLSALTRFIEGQRPDEVIGDDICEN